MKRVQQWILTKQQDACLKGQFTQSKFSIKNLVKVFFDKVLWSCKPASKTFSKKFDGLWRNRNPSYFSRNFDGL